MPKRQCTYLCVWSCIIHSLCSFISPLINAGFGAFKSFMLWPLGSVVFWGQLLCQRQKVGSASQIQAAVGLFLICIPDSSSDNFRLFPRWKEEPFPCAAGSEDEAFTAPSCWRPEPNPAIYSWPTWSHYTSLFCCASLVCSESTAFPGGLLSLWAVPIPARRLLTCCCSAMHWIFVQIPGSLHGILSFSSEICAYHTCSKVDLNCPSTVGYYI